MGNIDLGFFHLGVFIFIQCQRCLEPLRLFACVQHRVTSQNWMTRVHRLFMRRLFICAFMISPYTCVYLSSVFSSVYYQAPFHPCDYEAPFHNRADVCIRSVGGLVEHSLSRLPIANLPYSQTLCADH